MSKNKKIIIIAIIAVLVIAIISLAIYFIFFNQNTSNKANNEGSTKLRKLYEELNSKEAFTFSLTLDDNNKMYYAKQNNQAYLDTIYDSKESEYIIKDGNSYLIMNDYERYYTYKNNETNLDKITVQLADVISKERATGKEEVNGKQLNYEEYTGETQFTFKDLEGTNEENIKTRFYFDGDKLVYIKTIVNQEEELLKVDISYNVDQNLFEIPSGYTEG